MPDATSNNDTSNDPTLIPEASHAEETTPKTTEHSEGIVWNNFRCRVLFTSRATSKDLNNDGMNFRTTSTILPTSVGQDTSSQSHQNTVASFNNARAFQRIMESNFKAHPGPDQVLLPFGINPSDSSAIGDCLEKAQAEYVANELARVHNAWSDNGRFPLYFDHEYMEPKMFPCTPAETVHQ